jgi:hypothetical protein
LEEKELKGEKVNRREVVKKWIKKKGIYTKERSCCCRKVA